MDATALALRSAPRAPAPPPAAEARDAPIRLRPGARLLCRRCRLPVTADGYRVTIGGAFAHRRTNPAGYEFEFGCFGQAPGAAVAGPPVLEHTWFAGYAWTLTLCRGCGGHLGWHFAGDGAGFFGLILDRLEPEADGPA